MVLVPVVVNKISTIPRPRLKSSFSAHALELGEDPQFRARVDWGPGVGGVVWSLSRVSVECGDDSVTGG